MISLLIQAIFAGICISIAATVFLSVGGGVVGSLLFSMGLLTILSFQFKLYTGVVGYTSTKKDILNGDVTVNGKSITIDMKLGLDETGELNHSFVIKVTETMIDFTYSSNNFGSLNAKLNIKENKVNLSIPSLTNAIDYTELTEDDLNKIIINITNDENIKNFVEKLGGTVNSGLIGL